MYPLPNVRSSAQPCRFECNAAEKPFFRRNFFSQNPNCFSKLLSWLRCKAFYPFHRGQCDSIIKPRLQYLSLKNGEERNSKRQRFSACLSTLSAQKIVINKKIWTRRLCGIADTLIYLATLKKNTS